LQECSGGHPEWHILGNCLDVINGNCTFKLQNGLCFYLSQNWDLIIAHPPCTYLTKAATQCHSLKCFPDEYIIDRALLRILAANLFLTIMKADCEKIAIENPVGVMSSIYRRPNQYIEPYYFCSDITDEDNYATKKTGLWLKGLPELTYNITVQNPLITAAVLSNGKRKNWTETHHGSKERSKTFPGIAKAMAEQWG
jgi:hypothetical protein